MHIKFPVALVLAVLPICFTHAADRDWSTYLGDPTSSHYSELKQINRRNVSKLEVAWVYNAGDGRKDNRSQIQCNPIIIVG